MNYEDDYEEEYIYDHDYEYEGIVEQESYCRHQVINHDMNDGYLRGVCTKGCYKLCGHWELANEYVCADFEQ